jgi:hypothetical protein
VNQALKTQEDKEIYALSDGRPTREIAKILGVKHTLVFRRWSDWYSQGLMRDSHKFKGRKEAVFSFEELGLQLPDRIRALRQPASTVEDGSEQTLSAELTEEPRSNGTHSTVPKPNQDD